MSEEQTSPTLVIKKNDKELVDQLKKLEDKGYLTKQRLSDEEIEQLKKNQKNILKRILHKAVFNNSTLVDRGAVEFRAMIVKSGKNPNNYFTKQIKIEKITEQDDGAIELDGLLVIANRTDAHGDLFTKESIEHAINNYTREGRTPFVDIQHDEIFRSGVWIKEIFLVKKNDPTYDSELEGSLAVRIRVEDPVIKQKVLNGELQELSVSGFAEPQEVSQDENLLQKGLDFIGNYIEKALGKNNKEHKVEELTMSEIKEILNKLSEVEKGLQEQIEKVNSEVSELKKSQQTVEETVTETKTELEQEADEKAEVEKKKEQETDEKFSSLEKTIENQNEMVEKLTEAIVNLEKQRTIPRDNGQDHTGNDNNLFLFNKKLEKV